MRRGTRAPWIFFLFVLLLGFGAVYVDLANTPVWPSNKGINLFGYKNSLQVQQGLDLQGGIQFVLQASCPSSKPTCNSQYIQNNLDAVVNNLNQRVSQGLGVTEAVIRTEGGNRISVELPGLQDDQQAKALLGQTGQMSIIDTQAQQLQVGQVVQTCTTKCATGQYQVVFTGGQLDPASISAGLSSDTNAPIVTFAFSGGAKTQFATYTRNHINQFLTVTLDNKVIESATIISEIDGNGQITGLPDVQTAQNLASLLRYGALPLPLTYVSESHLAATLGQQAIQYSLRAAAVGLGLVILFMLLYYRLPGLLADVALLLYAFLLFAVIKLIGVTLSTAGIAGLILSVGMAVDANVLIFERIKEELREGRTMAAAIDIGFKRAWPSIRDSNMSTLITCAILYWFGNNFGATIIVGFATNLFIGVLISLFTAVVVTRNFLQVLLISGVASHPALYGLPRDAIRVPRYTPPRPRLSSMVPAIAGAGSGSAAQRADDNEGVLSGRSNGNHSAAGQSNTAGARHGED